MKPKRLPCCPAGAAATLQWQLNGVNNSVRNCDIMPACATLTAHWAPLGPHSRLGHRKCLNRGRAAVIVRDGLTRRQLISIGERPPDPASMCKHSILYLDFTGKGMLL